MERAFSALALSVSSSQPAGPGWNEGRLWRSSMRMCRSGNPVNQTRNVHSPARARARCGPNSRGRHPAARNGNFERGIDGEA